MADRIQQGVFPYPPPVMLHLVTRWDMSWLEMTQLVMNGSPSTTLKSDVNGFTEGHVPLGYFSEHLK